MSEVGADRFPYRFDPDRVVARGIIRRRGAIVGWTAPLAWFR
jgi:hypothetical protein